MAHEIYLSTQPESGRERYVPGTAGTLPGPVVPAHLPQKA